MRQLLKLLKAVLNLHLCYSMHNAASCGKQHCCAGGQEALFVHPVVQMLLLCAEGDSLKDGLQVVHISEAASMALPVWEGEHLQHQSAQPSTAAHSTHTNNQLLTWLA